jgi:hypothetical protein
MLSNVSHEKDRFVLRKERRISNIIDGNREFKSALRSVKKLPISIERETYFFVVLDHVFDAVHIVLRHVHVHRSNPHRFGSYVLFLCLIR